MCAENMNLNELQWTIMKRTNFCISYTWHTSARTISLSNCGNTNNIILSSSKWNFLLESSLTQVDSNVCSIPGLTPTVLKVGCTVANREIKRLEKAENFVLSTKGAPLSLTNSGARRICRILGCWYKIHLTSCQFMTSNHDLKWIGTEKSVPVQDCWNQVIATNPTYIVVQVIYWNHL